MKSDEAKRKGMVIMKSLSERTDRLSEAAGKGPHQYALIWREKSAYPVFPLVAFPEI